MHAAENSVTGHDPAGVLQHLPNMRCRLLLLPLQTPVEGLVSADSCTLSCTYADAVDLVTRASINASLALGMFTATSTALPYSGTTMHVSFVCLLSWMFIGSTIFKQGT